jgi:hypothetical protein
MAAHGILLIYEALMAAEGKHVGELSQHYAR